MAYSLSEVLQTSVQIGEREPPEINGIAKLGSSPRPFFLLISVVSLGSPKTTLRFHQTDSQNLLEAIARSDSSH